MASQQSLYKTSYNFKYSGYNEVLQHQHRMPTHQSQISHSKAHSNWSVDHKRGADRKETRHALLPNLSSQDQLFSP